MRILPPAAIILLALSGCGQPPAAPATDVAADLPVAAAGEEEAGQTRQGEITAIDAATGEERAMPADSTAPTPYDVARRAAAEEAAGEARDARAAAADPADPARQSNPADLLSTDESVTAG